MPEPQYEEELEIDLRDAFLRLWRRKWILVGLFIVAVVGAYLYSQWILFAFAALLLYAFNVLDLLRYEEYVKNKSRSKAGNSG